jgi:exosortase
MPPDTLSLPVEPYTAAPRTRTTRLVAALAAVELIVLFAPTVQWLYERWTLSVWHNAHGMFVPPVVAYLAYDELRRTRTAPRASSAWGFAFLVPALLIHALDAGMHTQLLSAIALVLTLPGLALLLFGVERTRALAFPLAFTLFALPIPLGFTEPIHLQLRHLTTTATANLLPLLGVWVSPEGTTLHVANGSLDVTDACSGFSTLYAAVALAFLVAYSAPTARHRIVVLLAAVPLAIAANVLRVVFLVILAVGQGFEVLDTFIHPLSGLLTFALALPAVFWLGATPKIGRRA